MKTNVKLVLVSILVVSVFFSGRAVAEVNEQQKSEVLRIMHESLQNEKCQASQQKEQFRAEQQAYAEFQIEVQIVEAEFDSLFPADTAPLDRKLGDITVERLNRVLAADKGQLITAALVNTVGNEKGTVSSTDRQQKSLQRSDRDGKAITEYIWQEKVMSLNIALNSGEKGLLVYYSVLYKVPQKRPEDESKDMVKEKNLDIQGRSSLQNREPAIVKSIMRDGKAVFVIMTASQEE